MVVGNTFQITRHYSPLGRGCPDDATGNLAHAPSDIFPFRIAHGTKSRNFEAHHGSQVQTWIQGSEYNYDAKEEREMR